ncbi:hypothetical protein KUL25_20795 [Rhodobacteraceae bacterium N5(2021)]|uniref:Uncharacterized protein n=1 Tax=Gymnodinialimonas phycosphaerae TaxID=2841589 RepID=A0A975TUA7_9RHOB|nr:hypothetical protein [Gymnodinialimonas phycosphaerae]MBY4895208.1 hypothetical protein [Gymnodinialimonas phycosphaerae]
MKPVWLLPLCLAACVTAQVYVTSIGPLRVLPDPEVTIFTPVALPDGSVIEPTPIRGGLVVRTVNGRAVPFEARDAALEALEAHCLDQATPQVPLFFGWRETGDEGVWSAAGCQVPADDPGAYSGAE